MNKYMDDVMQAAFLAGVRLGAHGSYDAFEAIPVEQLQLSYRAWKDGWQGEPWDIERWHSERGIMLPTNPPKYPDEERFIEASRS